MSSNQSYRSIAARVTGLVFLLFLVSVTVPPAAQTYWEPPSIAKDGPKDPGTPYEEPEGGPGDETGPTEPKPPEGIQDDNGSPTASPTDLVVARSSRTSNWLSTVRWTIYRLVRFGF